MPFSQEAVGGEVAVERARGDAVEIRDVGADDGAETIEIEVGVASFERVDGPFDQADVAAEGFFALEEFEGAADFAVAVVGKDAGHVGMQVGSFVADADQGHGEADHAGAVEGAEDLAAGLVGDDEGGVGFGFEVGFVPDGFLDFDAAVEVGEGGAFADLDLGGHEEADSLQPTADSQEKGFNTEGTEEEHRDHREEGLHFAEALESSRCLDWSQRDSSSGRGISARVVPCSRASFSISRKRRVNLALALWRAISGSTLRKRERFTATKRISPSSDSIRSGDSFLRRTSRSSVDSSRSLSKMPSTLSQSKPMRAALRVSWKASRRAGRVWGTPSRRESVGEVEVEEVEVKEVEDSEVGVALADSLFACRLEAGATPDLDWRSCFFRSSQLRRTWAEVLALTLPKTWGWRRIILSWISRMTSLMEKRRCSAAIWAWKRTWRRRSPNSSANLESSRESRASRTS